MFSVFWTQLPVDTHVWLTSGIVWVSTISLIGDDDLFLLFLSSWGNTSQFLYTLQTFRLKKNCSFPFWSALSWVTLSRLWQTCPVWAPPCWGRLSCWGTWAEGVRRWVSEAPHTPPSARSIGVLGSPGVMYRARVMSFETPREEALSEGPSDPVELQPGCPFPPSWSLLQSNLSGGIDRALLCQALLGLSSLHWALLGNGFCCLSWSQKSRNWKQCFSGNFPLKLKPVVPDYRYHGFFRCLPKALRWFPLENPNIKLLQELLVFQRVSPFIVLPVWFFFCLLLRNIWEGKCIIIC